MPETKWWLVINNKAEGPHDEATLAAGLLDGRFDSALLACPVGQQTWKPIEGWPQLARILPPPGSVPPPIPREPSPVGASGGPKSKTAEAGNREPKNQTAEPLAAEFWSLVTSPKLPTMANAICVFTIAIQPGYWLIDALTTISSFSSKSGQLSEYDTAVNVFGLFVIAPVTLVLTVLMAVGGIHLRNLRSSGCRLLLIGLGSDLAFSVLQLLVVILMVFWFGPGDEPQAATSFEDVFAILFGISAFVFEIVAFIWLIGNGQRLGLDPKS